MDIQAQIAKLQARIDEINAENAKLAAKPLKVRRESGQRAVKATVEKPAKEKPLGYSFVVELHTGTGEDCKVTKHSFDRHGDGRRKAHRHILADKDNRAFIQTYFVGHVWIGFDAIGRAKYAREEAILKGTSEVTRSDAELEKMQEVDNKLRDTTAYTVKPPTPATGMTGPSDAPKKGKSWQRKGSQWRGWENSRTAQGLPLQTSKKRTYSR